MRDQAASRATVAADDQAATGRHDLFEQPLDERASSRRRGRGSWRRSRVRRTRPPRNASMQRSPSSSTPAARSPINSSRSCRTPRRASSAPSSDAIPNLVGRSSRRRSLCRSRHVHGGGRAALRLLATMTFRRMPTRSPTMSPVTPFR
jgi:hypothetical protein